MAVFHLLKKWHRNWKNQAGKGFKTMAIANGNGLLIAISIHELYTHEIKLIEIQYQAALLKAD